MNFPILSGACVVNDEKVLILQQRDDVIHPGKWGPPGGHGNDGESLIEVAIRETKEETNLDIEIEGLVQSALATSPDGKVYIIALYLARAKNIGELKICAKEAKDYVWASLDEIESDKYSYRDPIIKPVLIRALREKAAPSNSFIIFNLETDIY